MNCCEEDFSSDRLVISVFPCPSVCLLLITCSGVTEAHNTAEHCSDIGGFVIFAAVNLNVAR